MARVGNVPTVSAYKGNIGQQLMRVGNTLEGISQDYERKQQVELAQAKKLYTQGLNINLYNSINELRNDPNLSANPQGLASAMDEVLNKTLQDVDDDDVKMNVMVDYQLKKGTYVNQAQNEFNRVQREKAKSYAFDSVYANIDSLGASFANALTGNYTNDDVANFQHSMATIQANINAKNPDGTYIFTDAQRRAMSKEVESYPVKAFETMYDDLSQEQKDSVRDAINNGDMTLLETDKGTISLRSVVGDKNYRDIKNFVNEEEYKRVSLENKRIKTEETRQKIDQYKTEVELSDQLDDMELQDALKTLDSKKDVVSEKYYKAKQKAILSANNIDASTQADTYMELLLQLESIPKDGSAEETIRQSNEVLTNIENQSAEGRLKLEDKRRLLSSLQKMRAKALPDLIDEKSGWFSGYNYKDAKRDFENSLANGARVSEAMLYYDKTLGEKGDVDSDKRKKLVKTIIDEYNKDVLNKVADTQSTNKNAVSWKQYFSGAK